MHREFDIKNCSSCFAWLNFCPVLASCVIISEHEPAQLCLLFRLRIQPHPRVEDAGLVNPSQMSMPPIAAGLMPPQLAPQGVPQQVPVHYTVRHELAIGDCKKLSFRNFFHRNAGSARKFLQFISLFVFRFRRSRSLKSLLKLLRSQLYVGT